MAPKGPVQGTKRHRGLHFFLIGVRLVGLFAALLVSQLHKNPLALVDYLPSGWLISVGIVFYHLMAVVILSLIDKKALTSLVIIVDLFLGFGLTACYGEAYFLLAFALPLLSICGTFGLTAAVVYGVLGLIFYGVIYAKPLLDQAVENPLAGEILTLKLSISGVQAAISMLMCWLYSMALSEGKKTQAAVEESQKTSETLYHQLSEKTENVGLVLQELGDQESKVKTLSQQVGHLEHELQEAYRDVAKARMALSSREDRAEEEVSKISGEMVRGRELLQSQNIQLEAELSNKTKMLEGFQQLSGSLSLEETLLALVYHLQERIPSSVCVVFMKEDVQGVSYLYPEVADAVDTDFFRELAIPVGEQVVGYVAHNNESLLIGDRSLEVAGRTLDVLTNQGRSAIVLPLRDPADGQVLGVAYLGRAAAFAFERSDLELCKEFLDLAGFAVARCQEFRVRASGGLHDVVTGLHNGMYLSERMEEEVRRGRRYTYPVSLLLIDIDNFTPMVERLEQDVLDGILRQVAGLVLEAIRDTDVAARIEADDFGILLVHSDRESAIPIGERIRREVSEATFGTTGQPLRLTVSVGVAGVPHDASDAQRLREAAYGAIADARAKGGNRVSIFPR